MTKKRRNLDKRPCLKKTKNQTTRKDKVGKTVEEEDEEQEKPKRKTESKKTIKTTKEDSMKAGTT